MNDSTVHSFSRSLERLIDDPLLWLALAVAVVLAAGLIRLWDRQNLMQRELTRLRYTVEQAMQSGGRGTGEFSMPGDQRTPPAAPARAVHPPPSSASAGPPPARPPSAASMPSPGAGTRAVRDIPLLSETTPDPDGSHPSEAAPGPRPAGSPPGTTTRAPFAHAPPASEGFLGRLFAGGNWLVRSGVVLLFIGVGFLLKFAADNAMLPVELRLAGIAAAGVALVALGLHLVSTRRAYALALQGGGVGLLYLTLYAAFRLYGLLPAGGAFAMMLAVVAGAGWLAWRQDALVLAVLGAIGGFAAPVLASTGSGSHVALFTYYAVLNLGVLGLALARSWRPLNLVGFAATFIASALWGHRYYEPAHFATVEPFLVVFFAMYVCVAVLFALRRSIDLRDPMDATLVFGTPLVAFGLQSRLVADTANGLAMTGCALAILYAALWYWLARRASRDLDVLGEAFAALAIGFFTVSLALALDARWTAASWALEGAALVWVGWRQRRLLARVAGALLQFLAGAAWLGHALDQPRWDAGAWSGTLTLAAAGLVSSAVLSRPAEGGPTGDHRPLGIVLGVWGLLFWYGGTTLQIAEQAADRLIPGALLLVFAGSALVLNHLGVGLRWPLARVAARSLPLLLVPLALLGAAVNAHPLQSLAVLGWPVAFAAALWVLRHQDSSGGRLLEIGHVVLLWLFAALASLESAWCFREWLPDVESWQRLAWVLAPAGVVALVSALDARGGPWPFPARSRLYLSAGAGPLVCLIGGGLFALSVADPDGPWPMAYLPVLNPLDAGLGLATGACMMWVSRAREWLSTGMRNMLLVAGAGLGFLWLNGALLRTLHFWGDIPYRFGSFFQSTVAQTSLSVLWAVTGMVAMVAASRSASRTLWTVGAGLMGVVMVKLMLVDLANSATIARIVSFISVGLLLMLVGYLAPVPPRKSGEAPA